MSGKLYIVATPIGNLKDFSFRAIESLNECDVILCEDVLHSLKLLNNYEIKKKLIAYHKFNEKKEQEKIISLLKEGKTVGLISDAGTPLISDPGYELVARLKQEKIEYTIIPGACAAISALVLSGMNTEQFFFFGFLKGNNKSRIESLNKVKSLEATLIFYLPAHSVNEDIALIYKVFGARNASLVSEISKIYEKTYDFVLCDDPDIVSKGEYVLIVEGSKGEQNSLNELSVEEHIAHYINMGIDRMSAIKQVARDRNLKKSDVYNAVNKD